ncbi:MAG: amino acid permease [Actinobacteria bacterium]|nr:amino acid permease [Actinomycetota bacterium]
MNESPSLSRHLGAFEVFTICSGTMVGAGIFLLPSLIAAKAGAASIFCFLIAGLISACAALSVCELSTGMPMSGGSYYFISRSMGAMFGSIMGWGTLLGLTLKGAFAFIGAGDYLNALVPVKPLVTAVVLCLFFIAINIAGTRASGWLQNLVVLVLITLLGLFVLRGIFSIKLGNFQPFFHGNPLSFMEATGMVFITYLGLIEVTALAEEVKDPGRNLPRGILLSIASVTVLYSFVMFVTKGLFPMGQLAHQLTPLADAAKTIAGITGMVLIILGGLMATISTGNGTLLLSTRYPFAMSRDNLMPQFLSKINNLTKTPARSIFLIGTAMVAIILLFNLETLAKFGSAFNILVFALINVSVIILRRADPEWYRPEFRSPLYPWIQVVGIVGGLVFIPFMGVAASLGAISLVAFGVVWYYLFGRGIAQPDYGLRDAIRTLREKSASQLALRTYQGSPKHSWRLLVPLWFTQAPRQLLLLSGYLARHFEERVHLVYCVEIPLQTPPRTLNEKTECPELESYLLSLDEDMKPHFDMTILYSHSRDTGFVEIAAEHEADLALMEWPPDTIHLRSELNAILRDMPSDIAILLNRPMKSLDRILIASSHPRDELKLHLAGALASECGSTITVLRVYSTRVRELTKGDLERQIISTGNMHGIDLRARVVQSNAVVDAIAEASRECDLLVLGSSPGTSWLRTPFGPVVEKVIDSTECAVLITRPREGYRLSFGPRILNRLFGSP